MTTYGVPICFACEHYRNEDETCRAFPEGIPWDIKRGGFDHRKPFTADGGVRFQLKPSERDALELYESTTGASDDDD